MAVLKCSYHKNANYTLQIGAAADRLGMGQSSDVPFTATARGRATASAQGSSDDDKVPDEARGAAAAVAGFGVFASFSRNHNKFIEKAVVVVGVGVDVI